MFGMSFGELCVFIIVGIVVIGPKDLPRMLRKAGQFAGKLRRLASDVRAESGIDEMLRTEGLHKDLAEIRRLARGDFVSPVTRSERPATELAPSELVVSRDREYPSVGADSHGAVPETPLADAEHAVALQRSRLAADPLYVMGDASAVLPSALEPPVQASVAAGAPATGGGAPQALATPPHAGQA